MDFSESLGFDSFDLENDNSLENIQDGNCDERLEKIIHLSEKQRSQANARERYRTHR